MDRGVTKGRLRPCRPRGTDCLPHSRRFPRIHPKDSGPRLQASGAGPACRHAHSWSNAGIHLRTEIAGDREPDDRSTGQPADSRHQLRTRHVLQANTGLLRVAGSHRIPIPSCWPRLRALSVRPMYEEFFSQFGLQRNPFHASSDPQFFFSTAANDAALAQLVFGIESRQGIVLLTGEPGTGKTTLLHCLLNWLRSHSYSSSYVFHSLLSSAGLLEMILRDFGISCASRAKSGLLAALEEWLLRRHKSGDCPVIVIDEAQALSTRALEELRMLLNLEIPGAKLVQIVLAGQPALEEKLRRPGLEQLRRRIMFHCKLPVLTPEETAGYIASRLARAGAPKSELFLRMWSVPS